MIHLIYPPQCVGCQALVASDFGLCPDCWRETPFIAGLTCDQCGTPLPGDAVAGEVALCDDCLATARPWTQGRAAVLYKGKGRDLVLALKHGDRMDLARPAAQWMLRAGHDIIRPGMVAVPVPLHWQRMFARRYNQSALLAGAVARLAGITHCPDLLQRIRKTGSQDGHTREGRFENMVGALRVNPKRVVKDRDILLVDDVMTSGATLAAAAEVCKAGGARSVSVLVMARVTKGD
jgi:ComF family protein